MSSCREDIIPPDNPSGNINEPVKLKSNTSYTFILNANNISTTVQDYFGLNSAHSILSVSLNDYAQGNVSLYIYEYSKQIIFQKVMTNNVNQLPTYFNDVTPYNFKIDFTNFTGVLKIQVESR